MAAALSCPSCRAQLKLKSAPPPGAIGRCPRCKTVVPLTPEAPTADYRPGAVPTPQPPGAGSASGEGGFLTPPERSDELGRLGPYRIVGRLGIGGMGVVFRAEEPQLRREVALKVMLPQFASNPAWKARFLREAHAQAQVVHDHVVPIYRAGEQAGFAYIAMPLLKGQTLGSALQQNSRPPLREVLRIGREIAEGLSAAHEVGLIHQDVKPSNVWLDDRKRKVKILDFGLARAADTTDPIAGETAGPDRTDPAVAAPLTVLGAIVGTPLYMSPEQARGEPVDHRTDLFSLGVVLYQMATGTLPFAGPTVEAVLAAVEMVRPPAPSTRNADIPAPVSDFIMRLLAKPPEARPASAEEVAEELQRLEAGLTPALVVTPVIANDPWSDLGDEPSSPGPTEPVRRSRGGRRLLLAGAVAGCAAVGLAVVLAREGKRSPKTNPEPPAVAKAAPGAKPSAPPDKASPLESGPEAALAPVVAPALEVAPPPRPVLFKLPPWPEERHFRPYSSPAGDYKALFPGFVRSQSTPFIVGKDTVRKLTTDSVAWWNGSTFLVGFVDYPDDAAQQPAALRLDRFRDADRGPNSKILQETEVTVGEKKYPGRELLIEVAGTFVRKRIVVAGARLYFVAVQGTKEAVASPAADKFFGSFEITK
jgi:serine/threonine protein kinase